VVFEKRALREILGCKGKDVREGWRRALILVLLVRLNYSDHI
jgi:hypothetical protein